MASEAWSRGTLSGAALVWTSDLDGEIGTGTDFGREGLSTGTHAITLTATDSEGATGSASVTIEIEPAPMACEDFNLRLDFNPIEVVAGSSDGVPVFVDRATGFTGDVQLLLGFGADGTQPSDVLSASEFSPNPVDASTAWATFSFTVRGDLTVGEQYDLTIAGYRPPLGIDSE